MESLFSQPEPTCSILNETEISEASLLEFQQKLLHEPNSQSVKRLDNAQQPLRFQEFTKSPLMVETKEEMSLTNVIETLFTLKNEMESFRREIKHTLESIDFKKIKKNRTLKNRCGFVNRRGTKCRGYICKVKGSQLCYAHHILATEPEDSPIRSKLYSVMSPEKI